MNNFTCSVNVALTFEGKDQTFHNVDLDVPYPLTENAEDMANLEVEVVKQIVADVPQEDLDYLVKISLNYESETSDQSDQRKMRTIEYLVRNNAKYYFIPSQRDDMESRIAQELNIGQFCKELIEY